MTIQMTEKREKGKEGRNRPRRPKPFTLLFSLFAAVALCTTAAAVPAPSAGVDRVLNRTVNVDRAGRTDTMTWYFGESVRYNASLWRGTEPMAIPASASVTWMVVDDATNC